MTTTRTHLHTIAESSLLIDKCSCGHVLTPAESFDARDREHAEGVTASRQAEQLAADDAAEYRREQGE